MSTASPGPRLPVRCETKWIINTNEPSTRRFLSTYSLRVSIGPSRTHINTEERRPNRTWSPVLRGRNSAGIKPRPSLTGSSCPLGKVPHMKMIMSCSRTGQGRTAATRLDRPFKAKGKPRLQMQLCTYVFFCCFFFGGGVLKLVCQPLSISKSLIPKGTLFYPHSYCSFTLFPPTSLPPSFPTFSRLHSSNYSRTEDLWSARAEVFIELLFCFHHLDLASFTTDFSAHLHNSKKSVESLHHSLPPPPHRAVMLGIYLIDVRHLWPHFVLFNRLLFGLPAREGQHHLRGMRHPDKRAERAPWDSRAAHTGRKSLLKHDYFDWKFNWRSSCHYSGCTDMQFN